MKIFPTARTVVPVCALTLMGTLACSSADVSGNALQNVSLSFAAQEGPSVASVFDGASIAGSTTPAVVPTITKVQLVLTKLQLGRTDDVACVDDDDIAASSSTSSGDKDHSCEHVSRDPLLIDMPVDGTLQTKLTVPLAAGTYRKLEAKLEPVKSGSSTGSVFLAAHPEFAGVSVKVDGTYNGAPFTYKSALRAVVHMRFKPPLVIDAATTNATITVDVSKWFMNGSTVIDPTKAVPGSSASHKIEKNIRESFRAFKDNGKKGKDHEK